MRILIYIALFVLFIMLMWFVIRLFRNRSFFPALLNLFGLVTRFISPYVLIRMILNLIKKLKGFWKKTNLETYFNLAKRRKSYSHMYCKIWIINGESSFLNCFINHHRKLDNIKKVEKKTSFYWKIIKSFTSHLLHLLNGWNYPGKKIDSNIQKIFIQFF